MLDLTEEERREMEDDLEADMDEEGPGGELDIEGENDGEGLDLMVEE
jgi:hypothetical protein